MIDEMREANWNLVVIRQGYRDTRDHFREFLVSVVLVAIVTAVVVPNTDARVGVRIITGVIAVAVSSSLVFIVSLIVAPYRQRNAARRRVDELEGQRVAAEDRNRAIRNLEALRRDFAKHERALISPSGYMVPEVLPLVLIDRLEQAETELQPISPEAAGEFGDLAKILRDQPDLPRLSIADLHSEGVRLFDRAIERLATPH